MGKCRLCGRNVSELIGPYCSRYDKVVGDLNSGLATELGPIELEL